MNTYDITFIDEELKRKFGFDNVIQVTFREGSVNIITRENDGELYAANIMTNEYNKIIIEKR